PVAGAPAVLRELCRADGVRPRSRDILSTEPINIRVGEADQFVRYVLLDRDRATPYVVISPRKSDGEFVVDPTTMAQRLATQAVIARLDRDATWEFTEAFEACGYERQLGVCFDGAVRLYHPGLDPSHSPREHYLWLPDRIRTFGADITETLAGEIAERVTWRSIPPRFFAIIDDFDRTHSRLVAEELLRRKSDDSHDAQAKVASLETLVSELRGQLQQAQDERSLWEDEASSLEGKVADWRNLLEVAEQERDEAARDRTIAQARIAALEARAAGLTERQLTALRGKLARNEIGSLTYALVLLETVFPERVTVLTSAWRSAEEAQEFKKPDKAWGLMLQLVTDYWEAIQKGGGSAAKDVFTDATYGARESETVEGRDGARKRRTFEYDGSQVTMWEHLKIGVKDSVAETWRLHFCFDSDRKKIIIGHCGKHLDFK
ncbi:MAG: hypothetical protein KC766_15050, partial [Myxococcales bacterium]|nr:hypothetical protein [Myxococcales bacterium]